MEFSNGVAQESLLDLVLFDTFICGFGKGKISRFVDDAQLFGERRCFTTDKGLQKNLAQVRGQKGQLRWMCQGKPPAGARGL